MSSFLVLWVAGAFASEDEIAAFDTVAASGTFAVNWSQCDPVLRAVDADPTFRWTYQPQRPVDLDDGITWLAAVAPVRGQVRFADSQPRLYLDGVALQSDLEGPADKLPVRLRSRLPGGPGRP